MNPTATIKADVGFTPSATRGTVTTVNLSDIQSGKVKLPNNNQNSNNNNNDKGGEASNQSKGPSKGFQK